MEEQAVSPDQWQTLVCAAIADIISTPIQFDVDDFDQPLTSPKFGLGGKEMVYLFMALEKRLHMRINLTVPNKCSMYTINSIAGFLSQHY